MTKISIESLFLKYPTSMISDALDEIDINGAISGVFPCHKRIFVEKSQRRMRREMG